jgi:hypothetical protein
LAAPAWRLALPGSWWPQAGPQPHLAAAEARRPPLLLPAALPTVDGIVTKTPVPMWPLTAGLDKAKTKRRRGAEEQG